MDRNPQYGSTLSSDRHSGQAFDYLIANPPYGKDWKRDEDAVHAEHERGAAGRFSPGLPRITGGQLLFLLHMLAHAKGPRDGGSRVAIIMNGSPLFTGDAGSGESEIRRFICAPAQPREADGRRLPDPAHEPLALTRDYWDNPSRPAQVLAFARRSRIDVPADFADDCARLLGAFLSPVLDDLRSGRKVVGHGRPEGRGDERPAAVQAVPGVQGLRRRVVGGESGR
ncbi:MAG: SAM-dependent DNA methyltransferase [Deltaproteobacteria bacterium]|nr:SAM-dependent DNA methyltransferase [Deltaproteobacteria bacterium]